MFNNNNRNVIGGRMDLHHTTQLSISIALYSRLQQIAVMHYGSLPALYDDMVNRFIAKAPWAAPTPLNWYRSSLHRSHHDIAILVPLPMLTSDLLHTVIARLNNTNELSSCRDNHITPQVFLYTAIVWWTTYVYAP